MSLGSWTDCRSALGVWIMTSKGTNPLPAARKRVLLLNTYSDEYSDIKKEDSRTIDEGRLFVETPLGLCYVYTYAKQNVPHVNFFILDAQAMLIDNIQLGLEKNWGLLLDQIKQIRPDIIGIGAYYFQSARLFHQMCGRIKRILPHAVIVAGGNYPTDAPEKVLADKNVEYIIVSEGERTFADFLTHFYTEKDVSHIAGLGFRQKDGSVRINPQCYIADLSRVPIPDRSDLPMHIYGRGRNMLDRIFGPRNYRALSMTISRGCPFACKFCTAKNFWGRRIRYRDTESALDEMQELKEKYGATVIVINDDNFLLNKAKASSVMEGMIQRKLNLKWYAGGGTAVRVFLDEKYLDLAVRSGYSCFNLAIESSSDETLKRVGKPVQVSEVRTLVQRLRRHYPHLWIGGYFIIGFPFETQQNILQTLEFSYELELDWATYSVFKLLPKTELYDEYIHLALSESQKKSKGREGFETHYEYSSYILNVDGVDWDRRWLFERQYEYNLKVNFLHNRNLKHGNYVQALRDFEYVIHIAPHHAIAYRQAALAAEKMGLPQLANTYKQKEISCLTSSDEFQKWYQYFSMQENPSLNAAN